MRPAIQSGMRRKPGAKCLCARSGHAIQRAAYQDVSNEEIELMARGREKDRKTRKKHRKNIKRVKRLAKARRTKKTKK